MTYIYIYLYTDKNTQIYRVFPAFAEQKEIFRKIFYLSRCEIG